MNFPKKEKKFSKNKKIKNFFLIYFNFLNKKENLPTLINILGFGLSFLKEF